MNSDEFVRRERLLNCNFLIHLYYLSDTIFMKRKKPLHIQRPVRTHCSGYYLRIPGNIVRLRGTSSYGKRNNGRITSVLSAERILKSPSRGKGFRDLLIIPDARRKGEVH